MEKLTIGNNITDLVFKFHGGQTDKGGESYIFHLLYVCDKMDSQVGKIAGLLHDIIEDTKCTYGDLRDCGVPEESIEIVKIVSKRDDETYNEYIKRIIDSDSYIAVKLKLLDLEHNMDLSRLDKVSKRDIDRVEKRYEPAYKKLLEKRKSFEF